MKPQHRIPTVRRTLVTFVASLLCVQSVLAQDSSIAEQALIRQAINESVVSTYSTSTGSDGIPAHELYKALFTEILISPGDAHGFTESDWDIIVNLPSHSDQRFLAVTNQHMQNFCEFVKTETRSNLAAAIEISDHYEQAKKATDDLFNSHYESVLASLSPQGRETMQHRIETMNERMEMVHTNIDVRTLAQSAPAYAIQTLKSGCERTMRMHNNSVNRIGPLLLSEELIRNTNILPGSSIDKNF